MTVCLFCPAVLVFLVYSTHKKYFVDMFNFGRRFVTNNNASTTAAGSTIANTTGGNRTETEPVQSVMTVGEGSTF